MPRNIGKHDELFAQLCDPEHLIQSARAAAVAKEIRCVFEDKCCRGVYCFQCDLSPL